MRKARSRQEAQRALAVLDRSKARLSLKSTSIVVEILLTSGIYMYFIVCSRHLWLYDAFLKRFLVQVEVCKDEVLLNTVLDACIHLKDLEALWRKLRF